MTADTLDDNREFSDYGSDFGTDDEAALSIILTQTTSQTPATTTSSTQTPCISTVPIFARGLRRKYIDEDGVVFEMVSRDGPVGEASIEFEYDERNRTCFSRKSS